MKTYQVMYSLLAGGVIEVKATSKNAAKELIFEVCTRELLDNADFEDSLEVCCIEEV
jgi:hypothetical protein